MLMILKHDETCNTSCYSRLRIEILNSPSHRCESASSYSYN